MSESGDEFVAVGNYFKEFVGVGRVEIGSDRIGGEVGVGEMILFSRIIWLGLRHGKVGGDMLSNLGELILV